MFLSVCHRHQCMDPTVFVMTVESGYSVKSGALRPQHQHHGLWSKRRQTKTATCQNGDTAIRRRPERRQTETATRQYSNSYLSLLVIGLWRSVFFFKIMTEHTAPDLTEMNSFGVLVVTSAEHFELVLRVIIAPDAL